MTSTRRRAADPAPGPAAPRHRLLRRAAALAAGAVALVVAGSRIDSRFLFYPQPHDVGAWRDAATRHEADAVEVATSDGALLRGWLRAPAGPAPARAPAVIYLGGNAEEVSWMVAHAHRLPGRVLLALNYRGYGASTGVPHERTLYADAVAAFDWLAARPDVDAARIAVWGRSLGSGVATWVATQRAVERVVLSSPFDSIAALARLHQPVLAPLLTQPFDSLSRAVAIGAPALVLIGEQDTLVPPAHSERLAAAWGGPVRILRLPGAGHGDLQAHPDHWHGVAAFLHPGGG
jgi:dipeptidyl aminopeptidase/acylaminoacyl peptidase